MAITVCTDFWRGSQFEHMDQPPQAPGAPMPPAELPADPSAPIIPLPDPRAFACPPADFGALVALRRTVRAYRPQPLSLDEFSFLLWCSQGVERFADDGRTVRTVPSAGGRHAFETFLLVNNVSTLKPGIYRFIASSHQLSLVSTDADHIDNLIDSFRNINLAKLSAAVFIWAAIAPRMTWKFGERGFRYLLLDAGHVCQNLYLAAETITCGACAIGAFNDADMNATLGLDGIDQFVVYAASIGRKTS